MKVARGLAWLKAFGEHYQLDVNQVPIEALDAYDVNSDVLSLAYTGYLVPWRDKFNQVCDRLSEAFETEKELGKFLDQNGFDLENLNWVGRHILRLGGPKDWDLLTQAWIKALTEDRAEPTRPLRFHPPQS